MNVFMISGLLGRVMISQPLSKTNGQPVTIANVPVTSVKRLKEGGTAVNTVYLTAFGQLAVELSQMPYGSQITLQGELVGNQFKNSEGKLVSSTEVRAYKVETMLTEMPQTVMPQQPVTQDQTQQMMQMMQMMMQQQGMPNNVMPALQPQVKPAASAQYMPNQLSQQQLMQMMQMMQSQGMVNPTMALQGASTTSVKPLSRSQDSEEMIPFPKQ